MLSPLESKAALRLLTYNASQQVRALLAGLTGTPEQILAQLLEAVPELVGYFNDGSATLAADLFDELRDMSDARRRFLADPVVPDRTQKIRNAVAWAVKSTRDEQSLSDLQARVARDRAARVAAAGSTTADRLAQVVTAEVARPYRDTILENTHRDGEAVGWSRLTSPGACGFCRFLAHRGAVYVAETARFAAHRPECHCTARPEFKGGEYGPEASTLQYVASKRRKTAGQKAALRAYIAANYPD